MPEVPEEVLPKQRLTAARGQEPARAERAVEQQHGHAEVSTGSASRSRIAVMKSDQITSGIRNRRMPGARMLMIV